MRAPTPPADISLLVRHYELAFGRQEMMALSENFSTATPDTVEAILLGASRFAQDHLAPLNDVGDAQGCVLKNDGVLTAPGHKAAWQGYVADGWSALSQPEKWGGQAMPLALAVLVQEIFDRACMGFGMKAVAQRSAVKLIDAYGDDDIKEKWLPQLVSGAWGATICISEAEAGSDVGRIRTFASQDANGTWLITGEKCWISYGDDDLTAITGHCLLARTENGVPGGSGLSLFLVPNCHEDKDGAMASNGVIVRRIEHKMGLHMSPTCALGFESARGQLLGTQGRGLAQLFIMITNMRLSTGVHGLAIAGSAADIALTYASERRQGGTNPVPQPINEHADVQRQLLDVVAEVETLRGLILALANCSELASHSTDVETQADNEALVQWLLPLVKTLGGEAAFDVSSTAIQVLGGAGYTREWPLEQGLRDSRVLTIFEGTTGMQALDLVHRRLLSGDRRAYKKFTELAREAAAACRPTEAQQFSNCIDYFCDAADQLVARKSPAQTAEAGATSFLHLAGLTARGWIAARFAILTENDPATRRLRSAGSYWLADIDARAALMHAQILRREKSLGLFRELAVAH